MPKPAPQQHPTPAQAAAVGGQPICCYINEEIAMPCSVEATWTVGDPGKHPADGTVDACGLHVWALLTDAPEHWVDEIDGTLRYTVKRHA